MRHRGGSAGRGVAALAIAANPAHHDLVRRAACRRGRRVGLGLPQALGPSRWPITLDLPPVRRAEWP